MKPLFSLMVLAALMFAIGCGDNNRGTNTVTETEISPTTETVATPGATPVGTPIPQASPSAAAPVNPSVAASPVADVYTCPMHPEVVQNTPGKCPKCNMDLEKKS